jgi:hypothetical protein
MRLIKIMLAGIMLVATGLISPACPRPVEPPECKRAAIMAQFEVGVELPKTRFRVGEEIPVTPSLTYRGKQPITVWGGVPILFVRVYDAENRVVLRLPLAPPLDVLAPYPLEPRKPHYTEYKEPLLEGYTFILDRPGRYKILAWAEFGVKDPSVRPGMMLIYADPIWIEIVNGSN